jgi:hypothetical protein
MNSIGTMDHSHFWHIARATSLCVGVFSFFALLVFMIVTEGAWLEETNSHSKFVNGLKVVFVLATATGLLVSVPFAAATGTQTVTSFLVWEAVYACVVALGTLCFVVLMAHVATGKVESGDDEPYKSGMRGCGTPFKINPATGLPMNGALDFGGNPYGWDSHRHLHHTRDM